MDFYESFVRRSLKERCILIVNVEWKFDYN
jgi:hypothetical protein